MSRPFELNWTVHREIGSGGQGTIKLVTSKSDDKVHGALKVLNKPNDYDRRSRMRREVVALQTLSHRNIVRVIDSNSDQWQNLSESLYLVTEFIEGSTVEESIDRPLDLVTATATTLILTDALEYSHNRGILHRDIKPDNILLRNGNWSEPVLIDFGLSFNDREEEDLTHTNQHIGNRFIILPEQKTKGQRDHRTDITQCVGIYFYLLTGVHPTVLQDEFGNKPHQRETARAIINGHPVQTANRLNLLFDDAFNHLISYRVQSTESLRSQLEAIMNNNEKDASDLGALARIKTFAGSATYRSESDVRRLLDSAFTQIVNATVEVRTILGNDFTNKQGGRELDIVGAKVSTMAGISNLVRPSIEVYDYHLVSISGTELVLTMGVSPRVEFYRCSAHQVNWDQFRKTLREYYIAELDKRLTRP